MDEILKPLRSDSLVSVFVNRFEELILSGQLAIGQRLPSERELAMNLGVSRPVVHEGLVELQARDLITLRPRKGAYVNDFRTKGSLSLLQSLFAYSRGELSPPILESLLRMRELFELETARLASCNRTVEQLHQMHEIVAREEHLGDEDIDAVTDIDFRFHHLIAMSSGNVIYPLLMNSFKEVYTNLTGQFFRNMSVRERVFSFHRELVRAVDAGDGNGAVSVMRRILAHGEEYLRRGISRSETAGEEGRAV